MKRICALLCAALLIVASVTATAENWLDSATGGRGGRRAQREGYVAELAIYGEIDLSSYEYDHYGTLDAIDELIDDENNLGLILLMDTPGGSVYEMDELYHALMVYREETGRPVYAYMERECCSAGVFIAMAAERIYASRMTLTGSVGVYMEETSYDGLYEKLGVRTEYVVTGGNKVTGPEGLTDEQHAILQGLVDESFGFFREAIAAARGEEVAANEQLLDGRLLTATQALEIGLIDGVMYYDEAIDAFYEEGRFGSARLVDVTPDSWYDSLSGGSKDWKSEGQDEEQDELPDGSQSGEYGPVIRLFRELFEMEGDGGQ